MMPKKIPLTNTGSFKLLLWQEIHLTPKWRKMRYSLVSMLIGPCCLVLTKGSFEFFRWDRGNKGQLTMRQKSNVFSAILE